MAHTFHSIIHFKFLFIDGVSCRPSFTALHVDPGVPGSFVEKRNFLFTELPWTPVGNPLATNGRVYRSVLSCTVQTAHSHSWQVGAGPWKEALFPYPMSGPQTAGPHRGTAGFLQRERMAQEKARQKPQRPSLMTQPQKLHSPFGDI